MPLTLDLELYSIIEGTLAALEEQKLKWGSHGFQAERPWMAIIMEELGEVAKANLEKQPLQTLESEVYQTIASLFAYILARRTKDRLDKARKAIDRINKQAYKKRDQFIQEQSIDQYPTKEAIKFWNCFLSEPKIANPRVFAKFEPGC